MSKKLTLLGIFALIVVTATIFGYKFLAGANLFGSSQSYFIKVRNAKGLIRSSPVFYLGFQVGTVVDVRFNQMDNEEPDVILELRIDEPIEINEDAIAQIVETGFIGGKAIRLKIDPNSTAPIAADQSFLKGEPLSLLESMIGGPEVINPYANAMKDALVGAYDTISHQASDPTAPGVGKMFNDMDVILADMKVTTRNLNKLIATSNSQVSVILSDLASITGNLKNSNAAMSKMIANSESLTAKLNNSGLDKTISSSNDAILALKQTLESSQKSLAQLDAILVKTNEGNGTMAKLINDPDLYKNLEATTNNLNYLLQDFRLNPKRYVNVSVFGKKQKKYTLPQNDPVIQNQDK